ncbi:hypothetical protein BD626DRAFT_258389 [Schizophyllum amplum]|uniref:Uncharacterized protein n=1 Tax=Schizophyllum amplum TaxID=97359 RepID=A0A550BUP7_9AGAR|nr:hypothetical protein BD626DRAFT_258389 [Auriculariopsis ampla]
MIPHSEEIYMYMGANIDNPFRSPPLSSPRPSAPPRPSAATPARTSSPSPRSAHPSSARPPADAGARRSPRPHSPCPSTPSTGPAPAHPSPPAPTRADEPVDDAGPGLALALLLVPRDAEDVLELVGLDDGVVLDRGSIFGCGMLVFGRRRFVLCHRRAPILEPPVLRLRVLPSPAEGSLRSAPSRDVARRSSLLVASRPSLALYTTRQVTFSCSDCRRLAQLSICMGPSHHSYVQCPLTRTLPMRASTTPVISAQRQVRYAPHHHHTSSRPPLTRHVMSSSARAVYRGCRRPSLPRASTLHEGSRAGDSHSMTRAAPQLCISSTRRGVSAAYEQKWRARCCELLVRILLRTACARETLVLAGVFHWLTASTR